MPDGTRIELRRLRVISLFGSLVPAGATAIHGYLTLSIASRASNDRGDQTSIAGLIHSDNAGGVLPSGGVLSNL